MSENRKWVICPCCQGECVRDTLGVVNRDDFDPDEWAEYKAGGYQSTCTECGGSGKMLAGEADGLIRRSGSTGQNVYYRDEDDASEHMLRMAEGLC
jgi:hypothetical protein